MAVVNQPTYLEKGAVKIVIMDAPNDTNSGSYLKILENHKVSNLVRVCERTYDIAAFEERGVKVHEIQFPDGDPPEDSVIQRWLEVVDLSLKSKNAVAVQCVAGLGRAPVLAAIALVERAGMDPMDAISLIRGKRKGAINARQVKFLNNYKPIAKSGSKPCMPPCTVM